MCGIFGILSNKLSTEKLINNIPKILDPISHRGPDSSGYFYDQDDKVFLAHTRLSIVDLSKDGNQPMISKSGRYILAYNGEVYNHNRLKKFINIDLNGHSDTEVLLELIDSLGLEKSLELIDGMFAFALFDRNTKKITIVRDRFGEKPLYWTTINFQGQNTFIFASDLAAVVNIIPEYPEISADAKIQFFKYGYIHSPSTIFKNIFQLEPGKKLSFNLASEYKNEYLDESCWWDSTEEFIKGRENKFDGTFGEAVNLIEAELTKSVIDRSLCDVPNCTFLSGGIDSSLVTTLLAKNSIEKISTFSVGFKDKYLDETKNAYEIAKFLDTNHNEMYFSLSEIENSLVDLTNIYSEPFADSSQLPMILICKKASKNGFKVAISGDGADELFCGYNRHIFLPLIYRYRYFIKPLISLKGLLKNINLPKEGLFMDKKNKLIRLLNADLDKVDLYNNITSKNTNYLFSGDVYSFNTKVNDLFRNLDIKENSFNYTDLIMLFDILFYLPNDILTKVDRASMYFGLETRTPYLSHELANLIWRMPISFKKKGLENKRILRNLLKKKLPNKLIKKRKKGFAIPLQQILNSSLRELVNESIVDLSDDFNKNIINNMIKLNHAQKIDFSSEIWKIVVWQNWNKNLFKNINHLNIFN